MGAEFDASLLDFACGSPLVPPPAGCRGEKDKFRKLAIVRNFIHGAFCHKGELFGSFKLRDAVPDFWDGRFQAGKKGI